MTRALLALLLSAILSSPITAFGQSAGPTYQVEVLVFRNSGPREETGGTPPLRTADPDRATGSPLVARYAGALPSERWQLSGLREKLSQSGYRVLAHGGWLQTPSSWGSRAGLPLDTLGIGVPGLSGQFLLERGSLLHFGMSLRYTTEGGATQELSEIRRIRFNERHYFDHPGLGVIAVVTPVSR